MVRIIDTSYSIYNIAQNKGYRTQDNAAEIERMAYYIGSITLVLQKQK